MREDFLSPNITDFTEEREEVTLRPKILNEYIGQSKIKENLKIYIESAKKRGVALDHILLYGAPGLRKNYII